MIDRNELNRDLQEALGEFALFAVWVEGVSGGHRFRVFPSDIQEAEKLALGGILDQERTTVKTMKAEFAKIGTLPLPNHHINLPDGTNWRVESVNVSTLTSDVALTLNQHE